MRYSSYSWPIAGVLCLFAMVIAPKSFGNDSPVTAIELLTAFSGETAERFESFFRFSENARIVTVEIHAVGTESTTARYSGHDEADWKEVNNILRITTADGFEGVSGVASGIQGRFSDEHFLSLRDIAPDLLGLQSLDPVQVARILERERPGLSDQVRSSIDIALWDLAARKANLPIYEMLGAKRNSMEPYASLPFYDSLREYADAVEIYAKLGYRNFKFHVWGSIEEDLKLVEFLQQTFAGSSYRFMMDIESFYGFEDALRLGEQLDEGLFVIYEAPIDDGLLAEYAELRERLGVLIVPGGYTYYSPEFIRQGIDKGSWDAGRFDVGNVGGFTKALELLMISNGAGLAIEIQSWGHTLAAAANLHLMLANELTQYFEASMPREAFEFGMMNGNLLHRGRVSAPAGAGLGIEVDWKRLPTADFYVYSKLDYSNR